MTRWIAIAALLCGGAVYADIPAGEGYLEITVPAPDASISDYSFLVDLSAFVLDAAWVANWNTNLNGYGRACKADGSTELATDWIASDYSNETGQVRICYSGAWADTTTIRLWPPNSSRTQYAAGDTYGQYAAYDGSWEAYYPCEEASGDLTDRTSTQLTLADAGTPTYQQTGKIGYGIALDYGSDYFQADTAATSSQPGAFMGWGYPNDLTQAHVLLSVVDKDVNDDSILIAFYGNGTGDPAGLSVINAGAVDVSTTVGYTEDAWNHIAGVDASATSHSIYLAGANKQTKANSKTPVGYDRTTIGKLNRSSPYGGFYGKVDEVSIHSAERSDAWIEEEYESTNNQATYYSISYVAAGASGLPVIERLFVSCAN